MLGSRLIAHLFPVREFWKLRIDFVGADDVAGGRAGLDVDREQVDLALVDVVAGRPLQHGRHVVREPREGKSLSWRRPSRIGSSAS